MTDDGTTKKAFYAQFDGTGLGLVSFLEEIRRSLLQEGKLHWKLHHIKAGARTIEALFVKPGDVSDAISL